MLHLKIFHVLMAMSFMAGVFYLPRIIVHYKIAVKNNQDTTRIAIMGRKLFNFSLITFSLSALSGLLLVALYYGWDSVWVWLKIILVFFLFIYFYFAGFVIKSKKIDKYGKSLFWRIYNELSLLILLLILYVIILKPSF